MGRFFGFLATVLALGALLFAIWYVKNRDAGAEQPAQRPPFQLPVTLAFVERGDVSPRLQLTGTVRSTERAQLAFERDGLLEALEAQEADRVVAGDVLARLSAADPRLDLASAQADLALAERELEKLRAGTRVEEKQRLAAEVAVVEADCDLAAAEVERGKQLLAETFISRADYDRLVAAHQASIARVEAANQRLVEAEAGTRAEDIAIAEARVEVATSAALRAQREVEKTLLRAPSNGVVVRRMPSIGDYLTAGDPVFELVNLETLEIEVEVPSGAAAKLSKRPRVVLTVDELVGFRMETELDVLVPAADTKSRNFRGIVRLSEDDAEADRLRPGMFVRLEVVVAPATDVLIVPEDALRTTAEGPVLVRAVGDEALEAEWVPVRRLASDGERTAIESVGPPLAEGDRIVVTGTDLTFPGVSLFVQNEGARAGGDAPPRGTEE